MKRSWLFWLIGLLLATVIPVMVKALPTPLPDKACSPLYQRYCHTPGIEASFVKGFRINDTLAIDATLLHAIDSASWERLREELNLPKPDQTTLKAMKRGKDIISSYLSKKGAAAPQIDTDNPDNNDIVGVSFLNHSVAIYHTCSKKERTAVIFYNNDISTSTNKEQQQ